MGERAGGKRLVLSDARNQRHFHERIKRRQKFEQAVQKMDPLSKLLRIWELKGGISAQVTALEVLLSDGQTKKMIVRKPADVPFKHNRLRAADEFKLLHLLHTVGLAVPVPYHLDQSGEIFSTPYLVLEYIEGKPEFAPSNETDFILNAAIHLSKIHTLDCRSLGLSFLPKREEIDAEKLGKRPTYVDESLDEGRIRQALEREWPFPEPNPSVLLHGDFWPGNLLWKASQLVAVIDWEDATLGDPLADLASSRLEILWALGIDAMHQFTQQYQSLTAVDFTNLPYWDLCAALRPVSTLAQWGLDDHMEKTMRERHRWFVTQAFEKLSVQEKK